MISLAILWLVLILLYLSMCSLSLTSRIFYHAFYIHIIYNSNVLSSICLKCELYVYLSVCFSIIHGLPSNHLFRLCLRFSMILFGQSTARTAQLDRGEFPEARLRQIHTVSQGRNKVSIIIGESVGHCMYIVFDYN